MKAHLKFLAVVVLMLTANIPLHSQGYLVANGVTFPGYSPTFGGYELRVLQSPTSSDYTGFFLAPQNADTFYFNPYLDEGVRTFVVSVNAPVSLQAIQSGAYTELLVPNNYMFPDGSAFYLGLYTGYSPQGGIYENPMFGWAHLVNNGGVIELLDGALAYNAAGIYAGTQTIIQLVPEPTALSLIFLGLFGCGCYLRRGSGLKRLATQTKRGGFP